MKIDIPSWIESKLLPIMKNKNIDIFNECRIALSNFIIGYSPGLTMQQIQFFSQHVLMNLNKIISNFPVGEPKEIVFGYGSNFGYQILSDSSCKNKNEAMTKWLEQHKSFPIAC